MEKCTRFVDFAQAYDSVAIIGIGIARKFGAANLYTLKNNYI